MFSDDHINVYLNQFRLITNNQKSCRIFVCLQHKIENFNACKLVYNRLTRYQFNAYRDCHNIFHDHKTSFIIKLDTRVI